MEKNTERKMRVCALLPVVGALCLAFCPTKAVADDYTQGVIVINESQYGKSDSSINYLQPDLTENYWSYSVFAKENPGKYFGATNCFGAYHDGKLFVISKEAADPGAGGKGGIVTVLDASTLKLIAQVEQIDPSGARVDGRAFVGIDSRKGYVSTSNGIWVMNLDDYSILKQIAGTENPNGTDNLSTANPDCALYHGQCGMMVKSGTKVFAAHQSKGLLIIDTASDEVVKTISMDIVKPGAGIGSVVKAADGSLWVSTTENINGDGYNLSAIVRVDPMTYETKVVNLPEDVYGPATSWGTWNPDTFCATGTSNCLVWTGADISWSANSLVYRYDIASGEVTNIIDLADDPDGEMWKIYYPSLRVNPGDDTIYMSLFKDYVSQDYMVRTYTLDGTARRDYPMRKGYWFPGQILFPQSELSGVEEVVTAEQADDITVRQRSGNLEIMVPSGVKAGRAVILDMTGRVVASLMLSEGINTVSADGMKGAYLLETYGTTVKFAVR